MEQTTNPWGLASIECDGCGVSITTAYEPDSDGRYYCDDCVESSDAERRWEMMGDR